MEWLLEEAASRAAQRRGRAWATGEPRRLALILQWYRRRMGITVVRAMARHRWRHSQYVGLTRVRQLEHSRRRADREHQRQAAGGAPFGGGSEDGAGALPPVAAEW